MGKYQDKDGDGYVAWYPDPKNPSEPAGAGVNQSIIDTNDADASVGVTGQSAGGVSGGSTMQYSAGVYPIYTPGKPGTPAVTKSKYTSGGKPEIVVVKPAVPATEGTVEYTTKELCSQWQD